MITAQQKSSMARRELERRSNDEIKIFNPTDQDYTIRYGGYVWTIKKQSDLIVPRYIALHYLQHMTDALILKESDELVEKEKKKYRGNFWPAEEERIALRTNNPDLRKKYIAQLWKGIVRKFGMDETPAEEQGKEENHTIPQDEQLLEELGMEESQDLSKELMQVDKENPADQFANAIQEET